MNPLTTPRRIITIITLIAVLCGVMAVLTICSQREKLKAARDDRTVAEGRTVSAVEAIKEIDALGQRGAVSNKEVTDAQEAIRNARPEDRDAVARARLACLQDSARCERVFVAG